MSVLLQLLPAANTPPTQTTQDGAGIWLAVIVVGLVAALVAILYFMNGSLRRARTTFEGTPDAAPPKQTPYEKAVARAQAQLREDEKAGRA